MYKSSKRYIDQFAKARIAKEQKRLNGHTPNYPSDIPELRRKIVITDFDNDEPIEHVFDLYRSDRIDCYKVYINGALWKNRIGWSNILAALRKSIPRKKAAMD
jgi:hypothetical protein